MSKTEPQIFVWGLLVLVLLGLAGAIVSIGGRCKPAEAVSEAVVQQVSESREPNVKQWISVGAQVSWTLFLLLVGFLIFGLWLFVCRVAYADSDLLRPTGQLPSGESPIPHPDSLPLEGD